MNSKLLYPVIITALVVGGGAFFTGMKYQESKAPALGNNMRGQFQGGRQGMMGGQNGNRQGRFGGGAVMGEIISSDDKSITVKLSDGSSKIVLLSESTTVSKSETGVKGDLKVGEKVGVFGMDNSDGSVTAQNVQLNPQFRVVMRTSRPSPK